MCPLAFSSFAIFLAKPFGGSGLRRIQDRNTRAQLALGAAGENIPAISPFSQARCSVGERCVFRESAAIDGAPCHGSGLRKSSSTHRSHVCV